MYFHNRKWSIGLLAFAEGKDPPMDDRWCNVRKAKSVGAVVQGESAVSEYINSGSDRWAGLVEVEVRT